MMRLYDELSSDIRTAIQSLCNRYFKLAYLTQRTAACRKPFTYLHKVAYSSGLRGCEVRCNFNVSLHRQREGFLYDKSVKLWSFELVQLRGFHFSASFLFLKRSRVQIYIACEYTRFIYMKLIGVAIWWQKHGPSRSHSCWSGKVEIPEFDIIHKAHLSVGYTTFSNSHLPT
jgi:hypothetical protein